MRASRLISTALVPAFAMLAVGAPTVATAAVTETAVVATTPVTKVIVAFDGTVSDASVDAIIARGATLAIGFEHVDAVAVTGPEAVLRELHTLPGVTSVVPQRRITFDLDVSVAQIQAAEIATAGTADIGGIDVARPGVTGAGVTVAVIDSGIFGTHPDFSGKIKAGANFEFSTIAVEGGIPGGQFDVYAENTSALALNDEVGHGTHVSSTIAGVGASSISGANYDGVAPGAEIVALKIATAANGVVEDFGFEENAMMAIDYMIRHKDELGIRVSNNSWGLLPYEPGSTGSAGFATDYDAARAIAEAAVDAGIIMVFSSGNDGGDGFDTIRSGAESSEKVITVGASCKLEAALGSDGACTDAARDGVPTVTSFSSHGLEDGTGAQVDIVAPGDNIFAAASGVLAAPLLNRCSPRSAADPAYLCLSGTSMSAPHVAGVAALLVEANPAITPAQAEQCMTDTALDMYAPGFDVLSGFGEVDANRAVACSAALTAPTVTEPAPTPEPSETADPVVDDETPLPTTGGGAVFAGLTTLGLAAGLRRRS